MLQTLRSSYKEYEGDLNIRDYLIIVQAFFKFIISELFKGKKVSLGFRTGSFYVRGSQVKIRSDKKGMTPDWGSTRKLWQECSECKNKKQIVYHLNEHTDGRRYRLIWNRTIPINRRVFIFKMTRSNKRKLAQLIKNGKEY